MTALGRRDWVPAASEDYVLEIASTVGAQSLDAVEARIAALTQENRNIHERDCFNLNPATNVMNPRAEAALASSQALTATYQITLFKALAGGWGEPQ